MTTLLTVSVYFAGAIFVIAVAVIGYLHYHESKIIDLIQIEYNKVKTESRPVSQEKILLLKKEFEELSHNGKNPFRVIALQKFFNHSQNESCYRNYVGLTSAHYSQIKYFVWQKNWTYAFIFWIEAMSWARDSLAEAKSNAKITQEPIDFEITAAPYFMAAIKVPVLGLLCKHKAKKLLLQAEQALKLDMNMSLQEKILPTALVASKLWSLTEKEEHRTKVHAAGLTRDMDRNVMKRIADHLGFKSLEELYAFCEI